MEEIKKIKYIFVVLHYNEKSLPDTLECVQSLEKISKDKSYKIIIVENGSNDNSGIEIEKKYKYSLNVEYILSKENLGFAKGNNLGCDYAKEKYNPEFLIVLNNDTYIIQDDFLFKLDEAYKNYKFDILGPYIYDRNLKPQNPNLYLKTTVEEVNLELKNIEKLLKSNPIKEKIKELLKKIVFSKKWLEIILRKILNKPKDLNLDKLSVKVLENIGLHGSCLIFSEKYLLKYKEVFYSKTFMYVEEDILYNRVLKDHLKSLYYPEMKIYHKEDKSTEAILGKSFEKKQFVLKNIKKSLNIYKEILLNGE